MPATQIIAKDKLWQVFTATTFATIQDKQYIKVVCRDWRGDLKTISSVINQFSFFCFKQLQCVSIGIKDGHSLTISASRATVATGRKTIYTIEEITLSRTPL